MSDVEVPHPRAVFELEGQIAAEASFEAARARRRLHHAWLLTGPEGVGKATFAYRAARRLLGAPPDPEYGVLGSSPGHPVSRQVAARSHPDVMVLEREGPDGKPRRIIPVDDARKLSEFFSKSPASAPHRVAIIDAADDLNPNAANAILKTLEEPPPHGILLMIAHAPGRLLPTIRSRCRRLTFQPLGLEPTADFVRARTGVTADDALRLARMAEGAPGRALVLAASNALTMDDAARDILEGLPQLDETRVLSLTESFRGGEGAARFALLLERLSDRVHGYATDQARQGLGSLDVWSSAWETLQRLPREVEGLNMDRADALFTALADLRRAARG